MNTPDWSDLRIMLEVARSGSAAAAAKALNLSHATVLRRIQAAEQDSRAALFDRLPTGYVPTEAGLKLVGAAAAFETTLAQAGRLIDGASKQVDGLLRFTTTDSLMPVVADALRSFRAMYPAIVFEIKVSNSLFDIEKHDADVALRPSVNPPPDLVGMRLCRLDFATYASQAYLDGKPGMAVEDMDWLMPDRTLGLAPASAWLHAHVPAQRTVLAANSYVAMCDAAAAGLGVAGLPCFLADRYAPLRRLSVMPRSASSELWLLTHPHLRNNGRTGAFMRHMGDCLRGLRAMFEAGEHREPPATE